MFEMNLLVGWFVSQDAGRYRQDRSLLNCQPGEGKRSRGEGCVIAVGTHLDIEIDGAGRVSLPRGRDRRINGKQKDPAGPRSR